jgi:hypothetical protein
VAPRLDPEISVDCCGVIGPGPSAALDGSFTSPVGRQKTNLTSIRRLGGSEGASPRRVEVPDVPEFSSVDDAVAAIDRAVHRSTLALIVLVVFVALVSAAGLVAYLLEKHEFLAYLEVLATGVGLLGVGHAVHAQHKTTHEAVKHRLAEASTASTDS